MVSEDSETEFGDEEMPMELSEPVNRRTFLIPKNESDPTLACMHFNEEFTSRYGSHTCPVFYQSNLEDAVQEALLGSARDRRLLAVYLHHDESIAANVFCSQVLCSESIVSYLSTNFLLWGWDLTLPENRNRFQHMCLQVLGTTASETVRRLTVEQLPMLLIVTRTRGSYEIVAAQSATVSVEELMNVLLHADEVFKQQQNQEIVEEEERLAREEMVKMQDVAYEASLQADRDKERQKQNEEREKMALMEAEQKARQQKQLEDDMKEAVKLSMAETVPEEPSESCTDPVARLRIRCPGGDMLNRRFLGKHTLQNLLNFLTSKGFNSENFKVLTTYPRRDLTTENPQKSLEELKMCPTETLILEERS